MKSFKYFLLEQTKPDHVEALYHSLVAAEHRGVVKDPTKYDSKLQIRTKYQPKDNVSTAYGPAQITLQTAEDTLNRHKNLFSPEDMEYTNAFIEQGRKMKDADPEDATYGYGGAGDLSDEKYHIPYKQLAIKVLKGKMEDAGIDYSKPFDEDNLNKVIKLWRGVGETDTVNKKGKTIKGDPDYFNVARDQYSSFMTKPVTPAPAPQPEQTPAEQPKPEDDSSYTIKAGDTAWKIGGGTNQGVKKLQDMNPGVDLDRVKPGQKLKVR